jgi:chlorite dismutase
LVVADGPLKVRFAAGDVGAWRIEQLSPVRGESLAPAPHLSIEEGRPVEAGNSVWALSGVISNLRYTTAIEVAALRAAQAPLGRPAATCAALIPIRKSESWWALPQDERRRIYEEQSYHTTIGLKYLPAIARRLHHGRDLGEPFDFLTWFEFAPEHAQLFEDLVGVLRESPEWTFVEREVDLRLSRRH